MKYKLVLSIGIVGDGVEMCFWCVFFFKQKTAYEMRISDWSSDVCSSDLRLLPLFPTVRRSIMVHRFPLDRAWEIIKRPEAGSGEAMHEEKGMTVAAILETKGTEVLTERADQKVSDVLKLLAERRIGAVPVSAGVTVGGVFYERARINAL